MISLRSRSALLPLAALLGLAGCDAPERKAGSARTPATQGAAATGYAQLVGRWQVAAVGGQPAPGLELSSDGRRIWWEPACAGQGRVIRVQGEAFTAVLASPVGAVCEIGLPADLHRAWDRIDAADRIAVIDDGKLRIDGPLGAVDLVRIADVPQSPAPAAATVPPPVTLAGEWRVAGIDGKEFNEGYGLALSGSTTELWWEPRCAGIVRTYAIGEDRIALSRPLVPPVRGDGKNAPAPPPVCAIGLPPRLAEVTRALDAATRIRRTPANGVELYGGGHSLLLFSQ